jgi:hypothetical protein
MSEATMTAYQLKSEPSVIVKAVQFNPHEHPWPDGVISWDGKPRPRDMSWGYVELPQKREHVFTGDYIVLDRLGNPYPVRSTLFEEAYRPVIVVNTNPDDDPAIPGPGYREAQLENKRLDHIDECMEALGIVLNLADPDGSTNRDGYENPVVKKVWQAVFDDFRNLSEAIKDLRKE